jgi:Na+/melibiose symporter-like transporter
MLPLSLFRNVTFNAISVVAFVYAATIMSAIFIMTSYTQNVLGHSPWETGLRFLPMTVMLFVMMAIAGRLTATVPAAWLIGISGVFIAAGLALGKVLIDTESSWTAMIPSMMLMGIGNGIYNPVRAATAIAVVEPAKAGMASGINETYQQVGWAMGIAAFGAFFQARVDDVFTSSAIGRQLGPAADATSEAIAAGGTSAVQTMDAPPEVVAQVVDAARSAFVTGLDDMMLACAAVSVVATLVGSVWIRTKDMHASALAAGSDPEPELVADAGTLDGAEPSTAPAGR